MLHLIVYCVVMATTPRAKKGSPTMWDDLEELEELAELEEMEFLNSEIEIVARYERTYDYYEG